MAKRRNPKKEKALRNKAYARQFRKQTTTDRFSRNRRSPMDEKEEESLDRES